MANEQEAAAGLYSLLKATPEEGQQLRPDPPRSVSSSSIALNQTQNQSKSQSQTQNAGGAGQFTEADTSAESMRKLTEMLLQKRPVVDALKNQGYGIVSPHLHDILSGRGNGANQHPGNIFFRNLIHKYKHHYIHTGPSEKKLITKRIVEEVQQRDPPGRFLKQNHETELWDCLDIDKVLKKTGQALREKAPELKKRAREEYKVRVTTSQESYFQNSRPGVTSHKRPAKSLSSSEFDSVAMRGYENDIPMTTSSHAMAFPMAGNLDALAYQAIPLASPSKGINDSFNMAHLAAITNQVDPINRKKAEQLVNKVKKSTTTLTQVYEFIRESPHCLNTTKTKVVRSRYPLPIRRISHKAQKKGGETLSVPNAISAHPHDVLFRDGTVVTAHPGSVFFCEQVNVLLPQYKGSIVHEKRIEQKIIAAIGARWPPGRFLCAADGTCTSWHVLTFDQALQATSAHLRHACFESQRVVIPNPRDVLVIRGNSQHQGNIYFHTLIEKNAPTYENAMSHKVRKRIAKQIMEEVDRVGGRFLKFNSQKNYWEPLELDTVMTKTLQGMKEYQKKKEQQQKVIKPTGLIVPVLNCIKESVEDKGKNSDPPGVFYNYYSKADNSDIDTLAIDMIGKDPPGQVANVIPELDVKNEEVQQQQQQQQQQEQEVQVQVQRPQEAQQEVQQQVQQRLQQQIQVHQQLQQEQVQPALIRRPDSPGDQNQNSSHYQQTTNHLVSGGMGPPPPPPMGHYSSPVVPATEVAPLSTSPVLLPVTVPVPTLPIIQVPLPLPVPTLPRIQESDPPASDSRKRSHDDKMTDLRPTEKRVKLEP